MGKVTKASAHLTEKEIIAKLRQVKGAITVQKWLAILHALVSPAEAADIAQRVGLGVQTVHNLISSYNRLGPSAIEGKPGKGGRRNQHMSPEEEQQFLAPFFERALQGKIATVSEIQAAFEKQVGKTVYSSVVYRLLERNGWRKIVPRPRHPKADPEEQDSFKKTSDERSPK